MGRPGEDDREAVDRTFAEMMAGWHLTAERPELAAGPPASPPAQAPPTQTAPGPDPSWSDQQPLFRFVESAPSREEPSETTEDPSADYRYVPDPLPPLRRPGIPALLGWIGIGYAVLVVLVAAIGVPLPSWSGWLAVGAFITGFAILITQLPRNRPPDAGNGAVL